MKRLFLTLLLAVAPIAAFGQSARVVTTCGTLSPAYDVGSTNILTMDANGNICMLPATVASPAAIVGNVASGATDAGNPVKVGGVFNTASPTVTNGQRVDLQMSANGDASVAVQGTSLAPGDGNSNTALLVANKGGTAVKILNWNQLYNGTTWDRQRGIAGAVAAGTGTGAVAIAPTSAAAAGITPVVTSAAANNLVLKASAGNLYQVYAANVTATAGFLVVLNATVAPADGAITPLACAALPANGNATISFQPGPASVYSTGMTAVVTSAASCFTKTTGVITAFIAGSVQ